MSSITSQLYDPTDTTQKDTLLAGSTDGAIIVHNLSQYELYLTTPDNSMKSLLAAWSWRRYDITDPTPFIMWMIAAQPTQANPPLSAVFIETYEQRSEAPPQYFGTYTRQTNIGNQVTTASSGANIVDGQPLGTTVTEATPVNQASSFVLIKNDGTFLIACLSNGVLTDILQVTPGGASTPASATLGSVSNGATTALKGTLAATSLTAGALAAGITLPGSQVTGDIAANQVGPGAMDSDVALGATAEGTTGTFVGVKPGTTETGAFHATDSVILKSGTAAAVGINNYFDGTTDRFINNAGGATQFLMGPSTVNGLVVAAVRFSTNTPTAGAAITWSAFFTLSAFRSAGGGAAGTFNWVGTTDPGASAGEGDTWDGA